MTRIKFYWSSLASCFRFSFETELERIFSSLLSNIPSSPCLVAITGVLGWIMDRTNLGGMLELSMKEDWISPLPPTTWLAVACFSSDSNVGNSRYPLRFLPADVLGCSRCFFYLFGCFSLSEKSIDISMNYFSICVSLCCGDTEYRVLD